MSDGVSRDQDMFEAEAEFVNPVTAMADDEEQGYSGDMTQSQDL